MAPRNCLLPQFSGNLKISLDVSAWRSTWLHVFMGKSPKFWLQLEAQLVFKDHSVAPNRRKRWICQIGSSSEALLYLLYECDGNLLKNCGFFCCSPKCQPQSLLAGVEYLVAFLPFLRVLGKVGDFVCHLWILYAFQVSSKDVNELQYVGLMRSLFLSRTPYKLCGIWQGL